ncbi:MAG: cbb3-type cytochrome c oxidase subunit I, partial [Candidatus Hydrogenedentes bacterium]|nr:cbb3-type cytochrome c oxidase subunit I [Candidatus Hydrogenedentota bacterium]
MATTTGNAAGVPDTTWPEENYLNWKKTVASWLLSVDHKRIGVMYLVSISIFFVLGGMFAAIFRLELLTPEGDLLQADTYNKFFTLHGVVMIFFFLIPSIPAVFGNFLIPLMIGAKDVAFPKLNLASWYIFMTSGTIGLIIILSGGLDTGWTFYTPLSSSYVNTQVFLAAMLVFISGFSSILTGLNFLVTIHKMRAPGLTWFRLPLFIWAHYATSVIQILGTPVLAISVFLVGVERVWGVGIFDPALGGDPILFQ